MPISRPRAADLAGRILERLQKAPSVALAQSADIVRGRIIQAFVEWDREEEQLSSRVRAHLQTRASRIAEGSREWDLLFSEEMQRAYDSLTARGE